MGRRPQRLSLAVGAAPFFNAALDGAQRRLRVSRPMAFCLMLVAIAASTVSGIALALAALGGFPQGFGPPDLGGLRELSRGLKEGIKAAKEAAVG